MIRRRFDNRCFLFEGVDHGPPVDIGMADFDVAFETDSLRASMHAQRPDSKARLVREQLLVNQPFELVSMGICFGFGGWQEG